jgi:hypothetical protein
MLFVIVAISYVGAGCELLNPTAVPVDGSTKLTPDKVIQRVRAGELGSQLAERARKTDRLWMAEIRQDVVDVQIFHYSDYRSGINLLVENGKLVLLCGGFGTGPVSNLKVTTRNGRRILSYTYSITSGIYRPLVGEYELGSGKGFSDKMLN